MANLPIKEKDMIEKNFCHLKYILLVRVHACDSPVPGAISKKGVLSSVLAFDPKSPWFWPLIAS